MERKKAIVKDAGIYGLFSYGAQFLDVATGILVRRFLGPTHMGIWAFLQVIQNYAKHAGLGVTTATARDVPYFLGKGDAQRADEIKNLVFTSTLSTAIFTALGIMCFAFFRRVQYSQPLVVGLFVIAALVVLQRIYNLFIVLLRSYKEFFFAGFLNLFSSFSGLLLCLVLTWRFRLYGLFAAVILNYVILICLILAKTPYRFSFYYDWKKMIPLLSLGLAMVFSDVLKTVLTSIDRIMIAKDLGFEALGHYSIALMAGNYLYGLPNMLNVIFFPHFQEAFARLDDPRDLARYLTEATLGIAYLFPFLIGFVWIFSSWLIPFLLPQYVPGIPALKFFILGSYFVALTHAFTSFIVTIRKHWYLIPLQAAAVVIGFLATGSVIRGGAGIPGVALCMSFVYLLYFLILSFPSLQVTHSLRERFELYGKVGSVFSLLVIALWAVEMLTQAWTGGLGKVSIQCVGFLVFTSPLLLWAEKDTKALSAMKTSFLKLAP